MAQHALSYSIHPGREAHGAIPRCSVALIGKERRVRVEAVVDSGATHAFFPASTAEDAGIDLSAARHVPVHFGGPGTIGRVLRVYIEIMGMSGRRLNPEIVFVDDLQLGYALLGRRGIFAEFNEIAFAERARPGRVVFRW